MAFLRNTFEIALQTGRLTILNRLFVLLLLAMVGAAVLAFFLAGVDSRLDGRGHFAMMSWWLLGVVLVPWTTVYFAVQAVHGDIEDRTVQYLFLRPVSRASLVLGKWLATAVICGLTAIFGVVLVFVASVLGCDVWNGGVDFHALQVVAIGVGMSAVVLSAVAAAFAAIFRWALVWATGYVVLAQVVLVFLPGKAGIRGISVADPVRRYILAGLNADRRLARRLWPTERQWGDDLIGQPMLHMLCIGALALGLAMWFYTRREYDARPRE